MEKAVKQKPLGFLFQLCHFLKLKIHFFSPFFCHLKGTKYYCLMILMQNSHTINKLQCDSRYLFWRPSWIISLIFMGGDRRSNHSNNLLCLFFYNVHHFIPHCLEKKSKKCQKYSVWKSQILHRFQIILLNFRGLLQEKKNLFIF